MKILVTGANRGLGLALTTESAIRGHKVVAAGRNSIALRDGLKPLMDKYPGQVKPVTLDVTNESSIQSAVKTMKETEQTIDVIINNSGVLTEREKDIEHLNIDEVHRTFDVNLYGPMRIVKYFLPLLSNQSFQRGTIINISSEAGSYVNAYGGDYPYALSKHALNMFSQQLRHYLKERGIRVFAVHPGWIKTDMGGEQAPGTPEETATGILDIIEGKRAVSSDVTFINFRGEAMQP
ncbi:short-chain dehydrogenase [Pullulanibacillus camelliae]|uniref:Short-chain dehydrogenase n=1 Tax=Pullulanibacillus camelliae TaxID=1707096 RepID=A0A8J2YEL5_9BACL|nr:SDR family oxidoreductase [Pullulanibacillus camelliae]GGE28765.1 short-chain dehydrogenase [Pullulanibacillus camelliae]